jgi:hypothetical protein
MVKVLIYSSKEIYDNAPYEGRAEADLVAYKRNDDCYEIVKNKTNKFFSPYFATNSALARYLRDVERDEWDKEYRNHKYCVNKGS